MQYLTQKRLSAFEHESFLHQSYWEKSLSRSKIKTYVDNLKFVSWTS